MSENAQTKQPTGSSGESSIAVSIYKRYFRATLGDLVARFCTKSLETPIYVAIAAIRARRPRWQNGINSRTQPRI
ncbi:hypothetical protein EMIT0P258_50006 [Pseudomonas sp. IT-P258]